MASVEEHVARIRRSLRVVDVQSHALAASQKHAEYPTDIPTLPPHEAAELAAINEAAEERIAELVAVHDNPATVEGRRRFREGAAEYFRWENGELSSRREQRQAWED